MMKKIMEIWHSILDRVDLTTQEALLSTIMSVEKAAKVRGQDKEMLSIKWLHKKVKVSQYHSG